MNRISAHLSIILTCATIAAAGNRLKLTAINNGDNNIAASLYRRIRNDVPDAQEAPVLDTETKTQICHHVTNSTYFTAIKNQLGIYEHEIWTSLIDLPNMNIDTTDDEDTEEIGLIGMFDDMPIFDIIRANPARPAIVETGQTTIQENLFACLAINAKKWNNTVYVWFLSDEYNLSDTPNPYIAGRFLFLYHEQERKIKIAGIAEEPAKALSNRGTVVEHEYLRRRANHVPVANADDDPICQLTRDERLRMCTTIFSSEYFEETYKFIPFYDYIDESKCTKRRISFQDLELLIHEENAYDCEEWMISCRAVPHHDTLFQYELFLSRVYDSINKVFVYRREESSDSETMEDVIVENLFGDVRFKI